MVTEKRVGPWRHECKDWTRASKDVRFLIELSDKYAPVENPTWRRHSWDHIIKYTKIIHDKV